MLKRFAVRFFKIAIILSLLLVLLLYLLITPGQLQQESIRSADVNEARQVLGGTLRELRQPGSQIALSFNQQQLDALMNVATYAAKPVQFYAAVNNYGAAAHAGIDLSKYWQGRVIYGYCMFLPGKNGFAIDHCRLGRIPIPAWLANGVLRLSVKTVFASPVDEQLLALLAKGELHSDQLHFVDNNAEALKIRFNPQLHNVHELGKKLFDEDRPVATEVGYYLQQLNRLAAQNPREQRLAFYLQQALLLADSRTGATDLQQELDSAFWAVISSLGNAQFIPYANPDFSSSDVPQMPKARLFRRHDLTLHFLYSAAFKKIGNRRISEQIGSLKEISDARDGGSGFSFVDLAANYAGIKFAENLVTIDMSLVRTMTVPEFEAAFMPQIADLPEGLSEQQMIGQFGGFAGAAYKEMELKIVSRLHALPIYQ